MINIPIQSYPGSLHNHSEWSNLRLRDSINRTADMMNYAIELGHTVLGITEHECLSNAIKVEKEYAKVKEKHPEFKVIRGNEIYLCRDGLSADNYVSKQDKFFHFILLAKDAIGHEQIRRLSTKAWSHSFKQGKMVRVPTYYSDILDIIKPNPGHVIASTACLGGFIPTKILQYRALLEDPAAAEAFYQQIQNWCLQMVDIFGKGNFYLEMQPSNQSDQIIVNKQLLQLSRELNIPYIITTDSHYLYQSDRPIHKAYLNAQEGEREVDEFYQTTYMMGTEELEGFFSYMSKEELSMAYDAIQKISDSCEDYSLLKPLHIPRLKWKEPAVKTVPQKYIDAIPNLKKFVDSDFEGDNILAQMIASKLFARPDLNKERIYNELNQNLDATWKSSEVNKTHWSSYFLNLQNIIDVCWNSGTLVGPGRGSGVGFQLLYILDIIQINNMAETTATFGWRFLNPDRVSVLD